MGKFILILVIVLGAGIIISLPVKKDDLLPVVPSPTPMTERFIEYNGNIYNYDLFYAQGSRLTLITNYDERLKSEELMRINGCESGINGGFYDTNNKPLGLVTVSGILINKNIASRLFNGFLSIKDNIADISSKLPENADFAVQTGPILIRGSKSPELALVSDKFSRRMAAAIDDKGILLFLSIYNQGSPLSGPMLNDMPGIMAKIGKELNSDLVSAINLDGGNASAFYNGSRELKENVPPGSWWCVKSK